MTDKHVGVKKFDGPDLVYFVNGVRYEDWRKLHPLTPEQIEKNRQRLVEEFIEKA